MHTREARARGDMTQREAQEARHKIGLKVESSYHKLSGYEKPLALKGARFLCVCLSYMRVEEPHRGGDGFSVATCKLMIKPLTVK